MNSDFWFPMVMAGLFCAFILYISMDDSGEGALVIDGQEVCIGEMDFRGVKTKPKDGYVQEAQK